MSKCYHKYNDDLIFCFKSNNVADIDNNIVMQIFSPLITSQRIMFCQFDNSYSSIQCENDFTIVLEEVSNDFSIVLLFSSNFYLFTVFGLSFFKSRQRKFRFYAKINKNIYHLCKACLWTECLFVSTEAFV